MTLTLLLFVALIAGAAAFQAASSFRRPVMVSKRFLFGSPEPPKNNAPAKKDGGGLFGGMGNLMENMKKAQEIAKQAELINKELLDTVITGQDPSGQAVAQFNGLGSPVGLRLSDALCAQGGEATSLAASQALVDAYTKSQSNMVQRMQQLYAANGVPIPPPK